jgi:hypothetical protein
MINSDKISYGTKIRNARQIQKFLARKKSGIANENQKKNYSSHPVCHLTG